MNITYDMALKRAYAILFGDPEIHDHAESLTLLLAHLYNKPLASVQYDLFTLQGKE